ncbi:MAG: M28 family peptidase [Sphingobacteriales bacterium]|nr:MAG: M28 family peptidase [Sphingobacteriales bacterium]
MKINFNFLILLFGCLISFGAAGQTASVQTDPISKTLHYLFQHVNYLSADSLEGRQTGSKGEQMAYRYISEQFRLIGLQPKGSSDSYLQPFTFVAGRSYTGTNKITIGKTVFEPEKDYFALPESGIGQVKAKVVNVGFGIDAPDLKYSDYEDKKDLKGKIFLINLSSPDGIHPHSKYLNYSGVNIKIATAVEKGASAILFYNIDPTLPDPENKMNAKVIAAGIPVIFILKDSYKKIETTNPKLSANIQLNLQKNERTGHNVIGYLDNKAQNTVVIGAHYDHLGYGESGGSLHAGQPAIHNGADDNASGVAAVIELARALTKFPETQNNNYLFIAFSGEELGLYGSNYFVQNPTIPLNTVNYMFNYDMVGRLDTQSRALTINSVGTSPQWASLKSLEVGNLHLITTESGIGPSDHTSFFWQKIPALHFFTGLHTDYHKPSDDAQLVNFEGIETVVNFTLKAIQTFNQSDKLTFTPTKTEESKKAPKYKVTLGIMPDYAFEGTGVKITGVIDGRPAQTAGLEAGDIILQINETEVKDMYSYMDALSKFKTGDKATIIIKRLSETQKINVFF